MAKLLSRKVSAIALLFAPFFLFELTALLLLTWMAVWPSRALSQTQIVEDYLKASNTGSGDIFGSSVAVSGETLVVGAPWEDSNATGVNGNQDDNSARTAGAAYVFVRGTGGWSQQAYLKASNTDPGDWFGHAVAISGDTLVVGAWAESGGASGVNGNQLDNSITESGAAYVFVRKGSNWIQQAYLKPSNPGAYDRFAFSVGISGDTIVIGAPQESSNAVGVNGNQGDNSATNSGAAYIFGRRQGIWTQEAYLKASNTDSNDEFGYSVAISGETVVVGARFEGSGASGVNGDQSDNSATYAGAAYVFVRSGSNWVPQAYLKAEHARPAAFFGFSVAASGNTVIVGAYGDDQTTTNYSGAAFVFTRNRADWSQQARLKASNPDNSDLFGFSVSLSGNTAVVGSRYESSNATGVNGDQKDNSAPMAGAAYVFARSGSNWLQQAYLKASNTDSHDDFVKVAISDDIVIVGATIERSRATGVNGDQSDNSTPQAGAAYVFSNLGPFPELKIKRTGSNLQVYWPISDYNFILEQTANLTLSNNLWTPVPSVYETNATCISVTLEHGNERGFYRLRRQ